MGAVAMPVTDRILRNEEARVELLVLRRIFNKAAEQRRSGQFLAPQMMATVCSQWKSSGSGLCVC